MSLTFTPLACGCIVFVGAGLFSFQWTFEFSILFLWPLRVAVNILVHMPRCIYVRVYQNVHVGVESLSLGYV